MRFLKLWRKRQPILDFLSDLNRLFAAADVDADGDIDAGDVERWLHTPHLKWVFLKFIRSAKALWKAFR